MSIDENIIHILELITTAIVSIGASSGFWLFISKKQDYKDSTRKLLIGLAHDRIISLSLEYIKRGWVSQDEYENLCVFLYTPYTEMGGNGAAKRLMSQVDQLPVLNKNEKEK